jgi:uncharacterized repeat protein (TIGR01451 family)
MNRFYALLTLVCSLAVLTLTGCQTVAPSPVLPSSKSAESPSSKAGPSVQIDELGRTDRQSDVIFKTNQIKVTKTLLRSASVDGSAQYRIQIHALEDVNTVRVSETMPAGIQFSSASPSASRSDNQVSWVFPSMNKGQTQNIDVTVTPTAEGDHQICSTVSVDNAFCINLFAGQPKLDVVKKGPSSIELGEIATWTVTVTNQGSADATNVVVNDKLPEAFEATTPLTQDIGTLTPGESRSVTYSAKAVKQGEFRNLAVATYDGGPAVAGESSAPITVVQSGIRVRKTGPAEAYVFKPVPFEISIENTGDTDLKNVRITDILPEGASVADNGGGRVSGNAIGWMIPHLPAGASQLISTEIAATRKGQSTNTVQVVTANDLKASDTVTTNWLAVPGVTVSITDSKDPVRVKEATVYSIQVRNQGQFEPVTGKV